MTGTTDLDDLGGHELAVELGALAHAADAPPSRVDITAAVHAGRRLRVRRRRVRLAATALALAAATVGGLLAVPRHTGADPASHGHGRSRWHLTGGVDAHDPLLSTAQFGWLPSNLTASGYITDTHLDDARAGGSVTPGRRLPPPLLRLYVYPRGVDPAVRGARDPRTYTVPAPNVNGRHAYWVTTDPNWPVSTDSQLRWQTADGRWAELVALYLPAAGQQQMLLRVAATATIGNRSVPLPMSISGLPTGTTISTSYATDDMSDAPEPNWSATISMDLHGYYVSLVVAPHRTTAPSDNPFRTQACFTSDGLDACLTHEGRQAPPAALTELGGLKGLLSHVTVYGLNPAHWTTRVLP